MEAVTITLISISVLLVGIPILLCIATITAVRDEPPPPSVITLNLI